MSYYRSMETEPRSYSSRARMLVMDRKSSKDVDFVATGGDHFRASSPQSAPPMLFKTTFDLGAVTGDTGASSAQRVINTLAICDRSTNQTIGSGSNSNGDNPTADYNNNNTTTCQNHPNHLQVIETCKPDTRSDQDDLDNNDTIAYENSSCSPEPIIEVKQTSSSSSNSSSVSNSPKSGVSPISSRQSSDCDDLKRHHTTHQQANHRQQLHQHLTSSSSSSRLIRRRTVRRSYHHHHHHHHQQQQQQPQPQQQPRDQRHFETAKEDSEHDKSSLATSNQSSIKRETPDLKDSKSPISTGRPDSDNSAALLSTSAGVSASSRQAVSEEQSNEGSSASKKPVLVPEDNEPGAKPLGDAYTSGSAGTTQRSHFRTRQISSYTTATKQQQQQLSTSQEVANGSVSSNKSQTTSLQIVSSSSSSSLVKEKQQDENMSSGSIGRRLDATGLGGNKFLFDRERPLGGLTEASDNHSVDRIPTQQDSDASGGSFLQTRRRFELEQEEESRVHRRESFNSSLRSSTDTKAASMGARCETVASSMSRRAANTSSETTTSGTLANNMSSKNQHHLATSSASHFEAVASSASHSTSTSSSMFHVGSRPDANEASTGRSAELSRQQQVARKASISRTFLQTPSSLFPSLAQEIGSDFAELDNALNFVPSTNLFATNSSSRIGSTFGVDCMSVRRFGRASAGHHQPFGFGRRPLSPTALSRHHLILDHHHQQQQPRLNTGLGDDRRSLYSKRAPDIERTPESSSTNSTQLPLSLNGAKIRELLDKAQRHQTNAPYGASLDQSRLNSPAMSCIDTPPGSASVVDLAASQEDNLKSLGARADPDDGPTSGHQKPVDPMKEPLRDSYCNMMVMTKVERIDQRMSDLCKKLQQCQTTDEAIELLKIMIQMIEKAWSYPVCGDDFGFKLCNSLRCAGGLDIILGFINEADDGLLAEAGKPEDELNCGGQESCSHEASSGSINMAEQEQNYQQQSSALRQKQNSIRFGKAPLRLSLTKLNDHRQTQDPLADPNAADSQKSFVQPDLAGSKQVNSGSLSATSIKDNDSDILTSDLGLDSTSVESLSYVSAATNQTQAPTGSVAHPWPANDGEHHHDTDDNLAQNNDDDSNKGCSALGPDRCHEAKMAPDGEQSQADHLIDAAKADDSKEPDCDYDEQSVSKCSHPHEREEEPKLEQQPLPDDANQQLQQALRKDELVFLSARLLSQCLTSKNRDYIVELGLEPVIRLACNYITMKSGQSKRLVSRSLLLFLVNLSPTSSSAMIQLDDSGVGSTKPNDPKHCSPANVRCSSDEMSCDEKQLLNDLHSAIGTEILQHLFKHSQETCSAMISLGGLQAILYGCRSSSLDTLRHCASALANLALYGGSDVQQTMIEQKAHVWLFPLAFNKDDNVQYYACLAIVVLAANQEIESDVLKSGTLDLVEPFVTSHEPRQFAESTTSHIHGQSAGWLRKLVPLLASRREEARNLACFHFAMEAYIKREQQQTQVFHDIGAVEPLKRAGSSPIAIASKFACQALRLIGETEPHKLSQQVPLWTIEDVCEWVGQIGFERFKEAFRDSHADGDLLLQLDEEALRFDIGIDNGIIRRRFLRELANLKRIADYSSVDPSGLINLLASTLVSMGASGGSVVVAGASGGGGGGAAAAGGFASSVSCSGSMQRGTSALVPGGPMSVANSQASPLAYHHYQQQQHLHHLQQHHLSSTSLASAGTGGAQVDTLGSTNGNHHLASASASAAMRDFIQYLYPILKMGITRDNIHLVDCDQLLAECRISNSIHRMKLAQSIRTLQEQIFVELASNEHNSRCGHLEHQKTLDCFVSYRRSTGSQLASLLKVHLQLRGFSVFIDVERLEAGKFDNNLLDSIKSARNFILVLSQNALDRCIGDHDCKDWVHKEIVAALASNCNIIPIMDNFQWPDAEQLPEDMRSIPSFNSVRWIHDYQDACVDKLERFIRGDLLLPQQATTTTATTTSASTGAPSTAGPTSVASQPSMSSVNLQPQSRFDRLSGVGGGLTSAASVTSVSTPSIVNTPSLGYANQTGNQLFAHSHPLESDNHPLSSYSTSNGYISQPCNQNQSLSQTYLQHQQPQFSTKSTTKH